MIADLISFLAQFIIWGIDLLGYAGVALMMAIESACIPLLFPGTWFLLENFLCGEFLSPERSGA
ncbi:MAG: hypothetical protein Athens071425_32 [Parcubacteria group bacterium Athens0714_25]|nr:MAG: hypothetical protein Athens071425_32 [Parcubacteria group bacterium Athens0714_25]